ncbi:helicase-associated domain-containing protein [Actinokineospora sp.]|uniref:helicase-associated domain-containing protein n=1 Tax=Actinokineospora sp. TaxID=1872133 RepID=UPI003D6BF81D
MSAAAGGTPDGVVRETERAALANLTAVLQVCAAGALRCSDKTRRPSAATVATVAAALVDGDFYADQAIAAFAWPLLVQAGGLAELSGGRLRLTARGHRALGRPPAEVARQLWQAWITRGLIDELSRVEHIKGQRTTNTLTAVKTRRQAVADTLTLLPPDQWITVDDLFRRMRQTEPRLRIARTERALWKLYIADPQYGSLGYDGFADWPGRYALAVIFEYAAPLGLVDINYDSPDGARDDFRDNWGTDDLAWLSRYDGLRAIRLTPLGRYALDLAPEYQPTAPDRQATAGTTLKVLANRDIVSTRTLTPADQALNAFAKRTADRVWTLSPTSLLAAIDAGHSLEGLTRFPTDRASHELPDAVTTLIADTTARAGQIRDTGVVRLIECADHALAVLIASHPDLRGRCQHVGDRHIAA